MTAPQITVATGRGPMPWIIREDGEAVARFKAKSDAEAFAAWMRERIAEADFAANGWNDPE